MLTFFCRQLKPYFYLHASLVEIIREVIVTKPWELGSSPSLKKSAWHSEILFTSLKFGHSSYMRVIFTITRGSVEFTLDKNLTKFCFGIQCKCFHSKMVQADPLTAHRFW